MHDMCIIISYIAYTDLTSDPMEDTEPQNVTTDGPSARTRTKKVVPLEIIEPLDRKKCLEPLHFKLIGTVKPKESEIKAMPLSGAYEMGSECHGLAVVINNLNERSTTQSGISETCIDEENLKIVLRYLGYRVYIYRKVESDGMKTIFKEVQLLDHTSYDSFICCILSHGNKDDVYGSNGVRVNISDLTAELNGDKCPQLVGKPKLFFIQACRGDKLQTRVAADGESLPTTDDFFFSFAVPRGYKAFHHEVKGSWYFNELCRALGEHATYAPLIEIMHLVHQRVAEKRAVTDKGEAVVQAPEIIYRLRKHIFFFKH